MEPTPKAAVHLVEASPSAAVVSRARARWAHALHVAELVALAAIGAAVTAVVILVVRR